MSIRSAAKAVIISDGKILLNKGSHPLLGAYYDLPGGGQHQYEPMEDTLKRECMEETG
jgi:8-oxo-dGTP pyrophosphatase MutT (NUDIX family)